MKVLKFLFTICLSVYCLSVLSQEEVFVNQLKVAPLKSIYNPIMIDSLDVNKKSFDRKNLLKTRISLDEIKKSQNRIQADEENVFTLDFAPYDQKTPHKDEAIQLLSFNIDPDRYCKAELSILTTDMMEVYVNDKMEKAKETKEDSLSNAKSLKISLTMEPKRYEVIIKRLVSVRNFNETKMKISITTDKKDTSAVLAFSSGETLRRITMNDILEGKRLGGSASISPSGNYFICSFSETLPGGKSSSSTELRQMQNNQVVYRFPSGISPSWIKGKDQLVYHRAGLVDKDIYLLDIATWEEKVIAEGVKFDSFMLSSDLRFALLQVREDIPEDKGSLKRTLHPSDRSGSFRGRGSVYLYDFNTKIQERVTFGHTNTYAYQLSPDNKKAILGISQENITERPFSTKQFFELDLETLELDTLFSDPFVSQIAYSPDGKNFLLRGSGESFDGIGLNIAPGQISNMYDNQVFIMDRNSKEVKAVTKDFDPSVSSAFWSSYDNKIYMTVDDKDRSQVYVLDPNSLSINQLLLEEDMISRFSTAEKSGMAIYRGQGTSNSTRLYSYNLKSGKSTLLADPFKSQLNEMQISKTIDWNFESSDGTTIYGRYCLPYGFDPEKQYPMIVYYYGGTTPTTRVFESTYPLNIYAALGYVVYTLQPSGTIGFGQEFAARHVNAWGIKTAEEIIEGTQKFCEEHNFVNKSKIGCIGASYGGFMTQYLQTKTDIFAAAVSHAGISNITSYWGEGYWGYGYSAAASAFSYPWNNPKLYLEQSPLFNADKINTPLLLLHGSVDTNVPIGESIQMYNALKILGKTVEFITVDGENHAIYNYDKRLAWNKSIYAWFAKWLKDQPEWWEALYPERE